MSFLQLVRSALCEEKRGNELAAGLTKSATQVSARLGKKPNLCPTKCHWIQSESHSAEWIRSGPPNRWIEWMQSMRPRQNSAFRTLRFRSVVVCTCVSLVRSGWLIAIRLRNSSIKSSSSPPPPTPSQRHRLRPKCVRSCVCLSVCLSACLFVRDDRKELVIRANKTNLSSRTELANAPCASSVHLCSFVAAVCPMGGSRCNWSKCMEQRQQRQRQT